MQHEITFAPYAAMSHPKITWNYLSKCKLKNPLSKLLSNLCVCVPSSMFLSNTP